MNLLGKVVMLWTPTQRSVPLLCPSGYVLLQRLFGEWTGRGGGGGGLRGASKGVGYVTDSLALSRSGFDCLSRVFSGRR